RRQGGEDFVRSLEQRSAWIGRIPRAPHIGAGVEGGCSGALEREGSACRSRRPYRSRSRLSYCWTSGALLGWTLLRVVEGALGFRGMRRDQVHERRRQAIIRLQAEFLQPRPDRAHLGGIRPGLDDGRDERREFRRR